MIFTRFSSNRHIPLVRYSTGIVPKRTARFKPARSSAANHGYVSAPEDQSSLVRTPRQPRCINVGERVRRQTRSLNHLIDDVGHERGCDLTVVQLFALVEAVDQACDGGLGWIGGVLGDESVEDVFPRQCLIDALVAIVVIEFREVDDAEAARSPPRRRSDERDGDQSTT